MKMKEITYENLFFLVIVNKLQEQKSISRFELEQTIAEIEEKYSIIKDLTSSNFLEELLEEHCDLVNIENGLITITKSDYIEALEYYRKDCLDVYGDIDKYIEDEYEKNKSAKIEKINQKYLQDISESTRLDIKNICNEKYKVLTKNSEARK